jgi:signal transduction histidine kinase
MTTDEIRPKQLRGLLLLLFLVPLIPTAMMARFMVDALRGERSMVLENVEKSYGSTLGTALLNTTATGAADIVAHVGEYLDPQLTVRIVDENGAHVAGERNPWGAPIAQSPVRTHPGWLASLHLKDSTLIDEGVSEQRSIFAWTLGITAVGVVCIAGLAVLALRRQLALQELKNTSVATVAHELRTPLASMRMLVDTLREGRYRGEEKLHEYLDLIAQENDRLGRLAESFLTYSRLDKGAKSLRFEAVSPSEIVDGVAQQMKGRLSAPGSDFSTDVASALPSVNADREALVSALCNLLDNALKYTGDEKRIALKVAAENGGVAFRVSDNGIGIETDQRTAIFRPFYQADQRLSRTREGCGLGLAIVQQIVAAHRGKISLESEPGKGSTFIIWLPL